MAANAKQSDPTWVRARFLMQRWDYSYTSLWRGVRDGRLPRPAYFPGGQRRWRLSDVLEWEKENLGARP